MYPTNPIEGCLGHVQLDTSVAYYVSSLYLLDMFLEMKTRVKENTPSCLFIHSIFVVIPPHRPPEIIPVSTSTDLPSP